VLVYYSFAYFRYSFVVFAISQIDLLLRTNISSSASHLPLFLYSSQLELSSAEDRPSELATSLFHPHPLLDAQILNELSTLLPRSALVSLEGSNPLKSSISVLDFGTVAFGDVRTFSLVVTNKNPVSVEVSNLLLNLSHEIRF
jgi:hypothetical protein